MLPSPPPSGRQESVQRRQWAATVLVPVLHAQVKMQAQVQVQVQVQV
jgi:hypothetical protein